MYAILLTYMMNTLSQTILHTDSQYFGGWSTPYSLRPTLTDNEDLTREYFRYCLYLNSVIGDSF